MAKKIRNLLSEIDKKFKESEEVSIFKNLYIFSYYIQIKSLNQTNHF